MDINSAINMQDPKVFNLMFRDTISSLGDGVLEKVASAATNSEMTHRKLREDAYWRAILPPEDINKEDLAQSLDSEDPFVICEMEPDSPGASVVSFYDGADSTDYFGVKYPLTFFDITTREYTKSVKYLLTYKYDLRQIITDNALRDMCTTEDTYWQGESNDLVGLIPNVATRNGFIQNFQFQGRLTKANWVNCQGLLERVRLLNGVCLCNRITFKEFQYWKYEEIGDMVTDLFMKGSGAFTTSEISGIKFIITTKDDLVPNGVMYLYAPPGFLGRSGVLFPPTMYVEKKKDILRFSCRETIGMAIGNTAAVVKASFVDCLGNEPKWIPGFQPDPVFDDTHTQIVK
ncbi:MAG: hypothetical protein RR382_00965 [Tannerellaceae bacterium]